MNGISGFTFIHNALNAGYPIVEAIANVSPYVDEMVVVDMESTDGTREMLYEILEVKIVDGEWWPGMAGRCLSYNHSLHERYCLYNTIWHFEADEVFGEDLAQSVAERIKHDGIVDIAVHRIQLEQNFQRVRWYPELVHRVFPRGSVAKSGHTTNRHNDAETTPIDYGLLWDVTNCFRDNWEARIRQQAELWGGQPSWRFVPLHMANGQFFDENSVVINRSGTIDWLLGQPHWTWTTSPFKLPYVLENLVGKTRYEPQTGLLHYRTHT